MVDIKRKELLLLLFKIKRIFLDFTRVSFDKFKKNPTIFYSVLSILENIVCTIAQSSPRNNTI